MSVVFNQSADDDLFVVGDSVIGVQIVGDRIKVAVDAPRSARVLRGGLVRKILAQQGWLLVGQFEASNGIETLPIMEALKRCNYEPFSGQ